MTISLFIGKGQLAEFIIETYEMLQIQPTFSINNDLGMKDHTLKGGW